MPKNQKKYLYDISESIRIIFDDYLKNINSLDEYEADSKTQDAVERRLIIIAEALHRLREMGIRLPSTDEIINRRNSITHQYDEYNPRTIWLSLFRDLPPLQTEADHLLNH
jgi:uncharacterized protein with HEPN domain